LSMLQIWIRVKKALASLDQGKQDWLQSNKSMQIIRGI
jgi:hypothetical protein